MGAITAATATAVGLLNATANRLNRAASRLDGKNKRGVIPAQTSNTIALWMGQDDICCSGYTRLCDNPEIQTACLRIAELIGSMTIRLMMNTEEGDKRIKNELSRMIDITPFQTMTRMQWMTAIVMNLILHGDGNSVIVPHTREGLLTGLEPISANRVTFSPVIGSYKDYRVNIDGVPKNPEDLLHIVYNPDPTYPWKGKGLTVSLMDVANNLKQAGKTKNAFMSS